MYSALLPIVASIVVATICGAITLSASPALTRNLGIRTAEPHLERQDLKDWHSLRILMPSPGDLLIAHWALFWRIPTRIIARIMGFCLRGVVGDADDLWLSTEL
ncbi:hypothetical protein F4821DRAFT_263300 [Hypoxylon rubiginosum]|uniref:Uncharacterized protein n=1 Tax=Hypoxylon rubiginosum TaxID=110542 RepID=A0ACC0CRU2_9PEZI|nr:hypothetical protein F4821DRAFT_263300 [Hypoxylon rubiginosum]